MLLDLTGCADRFSVSIQLFSGRGGGPSTNRLNRAHTVSCFAGSNRARSAGTARPAEGGTSRRTAGAERRRTLHPQQPVFLGQHAPLLGQLPLALPERLLALIESARHAPSSPSMCRSLAAWRSPIGLIRDGSRRGQFRPRRQASAATGRGAGPAAARRRRGQHTRRLQLDQHLADRAADRPGAALQRTRRRARRHRLRL